MNAKAMSNRWPSGFPVAGNAPVGIEGGLGTVVAPAIVVVGAKVVVATFVVVGATVVVGAGAVVVAAAIVSDLDTVDTQPSMSVTVTAIGNEPEFDVVPASAPAAVSVVPLGNAPVSANVYDATPPEPTSCWEYGEPAMPSGRGLGDTSIATQVSPLSENTAL